MDRRLTRPDISAPPITPQLTHLKIEAAQVADDASIEEEIKLILAEKDHTLLAKAR
jgi:hypothetical protein